MASNSNAKSVNQSDVLGRLLRAVILIVVSILISVMAVSFAVHHMRLQYEDEFINISKAKITQVSDVAKMAISGNDLATDPSAAVKKYNTVFNLMLADTATDSFSRESYGLFSYSDGQLTLIYSQGAQLASEFSITDRDISEWLNSDYSSTVVDGENFDSVIVPIIDDTGKCVGVFEYKITYEKLDEMGNTFESRILIAVIISLFAGIVLFVIQELIVKLVRGNSKNAGETGKSREKRLISSTIGYCFAIVLVVLLVMSSQLTNTYKAVLESERADTMQKVTLASSVALSYYDIKEGMTYPLPVYSYAEGKDYIVEIYTMAGGSFLRFYSSVVNNSAEQFYMSGGNDQYINCFQLQEIAFTSRTENNTAYVAAIAPIISKDNTVSGILEYRMPKADFESSVNGMSLSWIFTIISIAISMGIIIFEINLFISTVTKGISGNTPVLIMYGENANRFLSFFMAVGAVMIPIIIPQFLKTHLDDYENVFVQIMIAIAILLYAIGFFGFSEIRRNLKFKLTSRIALLSVTAFGYFFALVAGIINNPFVFIVLCFPIGLCFGMPIDFLRDYRINAGKMGYKNFDDRTIHNVQSTSYFLGVSVGAVIGGIAYERFGLLIVAIISGGALILTSLGMLYFMQNNAPVKESALPINRWFEIFNDRYAGRFLKSSFFILGINLSFMLGFMPNFLGKVGISPATTSFYYLLSAFTCCFVCAILKNRFSGLFTSKVRVIIQAVATVMGLLVFALFPTAKMLVISVAFLGIALGIHDFYYLYVLYLLCNARFKANLRKTAEITLLIGLIVSIPVFTIGMSLNMLRIVFLVYVFIISILAFIYPLSAFANNVDDKDPTQYVSKDSKSKKKKVGSTTAPQAAPQTQEFDYSNLSAMQNQQPVQYETQPQYQDPNMMYANQTTNPYDQYPNGQDNTWGGNN